MLETLQTLVSSQGQGYKNCIGEDGLQFFLPTATLQLVTHFQPKIFQLKIFPTDTISWALFLGHR